MNFLRALSPAEREAFTAVALEQAFARGSRLMNEGGRADHVMVILDGWTQVTVRHNGSERIVAERGPGQLVGERAALRSHVRSATVTALTEVKVLVMRTDDFASFISAHPRVLDVVENQIYQRLSEDPEGYAQDGWPGGFPLQVGGHASISRQPPRPLTGENCTVLLTDVVGFGALHRSDRDRQIIRLAGLEMMRSSLGTLWEACIPEDRGDGLLIVVPPQVPTAKIIECMHRELPDKLRLHNRTYNEPARFQLRIAANVGPVTSDSLGMSGEAIIRTARLVEAPPVKEAMAATGCGLGIVVSEFVYETTVRQDSDFIDIDEYRQIAVVLKEFKSTAWLRLVDVSPPARDPLGAKHPAVRTVAGDLAAGSLLTGPARTGYLALIAGVSRDSIDRGDTKGT
ncbi:MAG TPA: cyclic nucleotide-binding domain-containing protein [Trebonia sp.]|nr:cyclic nucleotide-binding domain-containing protein [Trebonia sp.]